MSFQLHVRERGPGDTWAQMLSGLAWPGLILVLFLVLFLWGGLRGAIQRFQPAVVEVGKFRLEAASLGARLEEELKRSLEEMERVFPRNSARRYLPSAQEREIAYYVHVFEFLNRVGIPIKNPVAWSSVGAYYFHRNSKKASDAFARAISLAPDNPGVYANRGMLQGVVEKDPHSARQSFLRAVELEGRTGLLCPEAHQGLAAVCRAAGEKERVLGEAKKALRGFQRAVEQDGTDFWAHFGLAWCLDELGDLEAAIVHASAALKFNPGFWAARYNLACLRARQGDGQGSVEELKGLLEQVCRQLEEFNIEQDGDFSRIARDSGFKEFMRVLGLEYKGPVRS